MRITVIAGYAPSLVNFRGPLLRALVERGHEVTVLAPPQESEGVEAALRPVGVGFATFPLQRGGLNPLADLGTLLALQSLLRRQRPELVLSYTIKAVVYGSLAARWAGVPRSASLITGLGYAFGGLDEASEQQEACQPGERPALSRRLLTGVALGLYRQALWGNQSVIFQNPDDRDLFQRLGLLRAQQRVAVVGGSGVDLEHFAPAPPVLPSADGAGPVFLCVARLLWAKGVGVFVEACRLLKQRHPQVVCRLLGPADSVPDAVSPEDLRQWRAEGLVEILDPVADVRPELARASVFVLPSFREGAPRSAMEAMGMARPVITTDVPGCRQMVEPGVTGLLTPPFEPAALMRAMERFVLEPELIGPMGQASRRLAEERFEAGAVARQTLDALPLGARDSDAVSPKAGRP